MDTEKTLKASPQQTLRDIETEKKVLAEQFEVAKQALSPQLQYFVSDFATWSPQEKETIYIRIQATSLMVSTMYLHKDRQKAYDGQLALWVGRTTKEISDKINLKTCIDYLKKQQK